jgi:beta-lactamase regulating signal transducer with metallopeptidase domain
METALIEGLANHLWQSTVFAGFAWLATLLLRKNHARARYALWLAASAKFLLPWSLLTGLGGVLPKQHSVIAPQLAVYAAFDVAGRPFSEVSMALVPARAYVSTWVASLYTHLPLILVAVWLCGLATVLLIWNTRWRQVSAMLRSATAAGGGREADILRRLERRLHLRKPIVLLRSEETMEPAIFGIVRPVLLWPERLSDHLEDEHIEAILMHEIMHVQHQDNLTVAIHMGLEAVFWFHPLVWWIERRLIEERERACDEAVLQLGGRPDTYAEGLVKACRFCVESRLACISGITGANLATRIVRIMSRGVGLKTGFTAKLVLALAFLTAAAAPIVFGQVNATLRASVPAFRPPAPPPPPPPPSGWFTAYAASHLKAD